jgi:hypothetical protein
VPGADRALAVADVDQVADQLLTERDVAASVR